jgi:hypothetical protein
MLERDVSLLRASDSSSRVAHVSMHSERSEDLAATEVRLSEIFEQGKAATQHFCMLFGV